MNSEYTCVGTVLVLNNNIESIIEVYVSWNKWTSGGIDYLLYIIIYNKYGIMQYSTYGSD